MKVLIFGNRSCRFEMAEIELFPSLLILNIKQGIFLIKESLVFLGKQKKKRIITYLLYYNNL